VNENDGGFYLSKASVVTKDPDDPDNFDTQNVGIYRIQCQSEDTMAIQALPFHDMAVHLRHAEEADRPLPIAVCLGVDPWLSIMAATPLTYEQSEYKYAAALRGAPFELTKTIGYDLDVPAGAEYVIEGEVMPRRRVPEGPFGEFPGSYSGVRVQVPIKVTRITHRTNPIYESLYIGRPWTEHDTLIGLPTSVPIYEQIRATMPEVVAVNACYQHGLTIVIAMRNKFGGYAKSVGMRCATTPHGINYAKNIILVDADVDPFDLNQVMWALSTRVRADMDVTVITHTPGKPLDPCSEPPGMGNKLIIDATTPAPPDAVMREVKMVEPARRAAEFRKIIDGMLAGRSGGKEMKR
jgi:UbiD family decarboxylase